jgi:hypothetical protein
MECSCASRHPFQVRQMSCSMEYCHGPAGSGENRARGHPGIQFNCDCYSTLLQDCRRIPPAHGDRKQFGRSRKLPAGRVDVVDRPRVTPAASLQPVRTDGALHLLRASAATAGLVPESLSMLLCALTACSPRLVLAQAAGPAGGKARAARRTTAGPRTAGVRRSVWRIPLGYGRPD